MVYDEQVSGNSTGLGYHCFPTRQLAKQHREENRMSSTYIPRSEDPLGKQEINGYLKWGGIGAGLLIIIGLASSCGGSDAETIVETETVTVTAGPVASTVTTTATTTVTTEPTITPLDNPAIVPQEPVEQPEPGVDIGAGAPVEQPEFGTDIGAGAPDAAIQQSAQFFAPAPEQPAPAQSAYYPNCAAARSAGVAPLYAGDPGYSSKLDRDGDGIACET